MSITPSELKKEKKYLEEVLKKVNEIIEEYDESIQEKIQDITESKKYTWENISDMDEMEISSTLYEINQNMLLTYEEFKYLRNLKRSLNNPYFGRIDFKSKKNFSPIYIGINGIPSYVIDWRAPIASLFYNYGVGQASYKSPSGTITGEITLKRQYKIENGKLKHCFNSDLNIDDEYLQEILASSSSDKMKNIVNTIQREQNEIIRNITDSVLIVQGIAGSGKTSVAMHRIAYLLYQDKNLTSNNILILAPNKVFSEYISNVLPELGEENVLETTFSDFASAFIDKPSEIESFSAFIERYYQKERLNEKELNIIRFKTSNDFKKLLDKYIVNLDKKIIFTSDVIIDGETIEKDYLNDLLNRYQKFPIGERIIAVANKVCKQSKNLKKKAGKVKHALFKKLNLSESILSIYNDFLESNLLKPIGSKFLKFEDLLPMMYLNFELFGYPYDGRIKHVIIDEAQDYSLLQLELLKKIFRRASFTILGDINQTINPYYKYNNLNEINTIFDNSGRYLELTKTYRSSEEIIEYTNKILNLKNICAVRRSNNIPVTFKNVNKENLSKELLKDVKEIRDLGIERIAIITKTKEETNNIYNLLEGKLKDFEKIDSDDKKMARTVVIPSYFSKGLEFDGVIVYSDPNSPYEEKDKYLFYVVCTRAQHKLIIYNQNIFGEKNEKTV